MKAVPTLKQSAALEYPDATPATPHTVQENASTYQVGDGWLTPERLAARKAAAEQTAQQLEAARSQWELENKDAISAYNRRIEREGSMGRRLHEWRRKQTSAPDAAV